MKNKTNYSKKKKSYASSDWDTAQKIILPVLLFLFAIFSVLSWFNRDAAILNLLYNLERGFFGAGVYLIPLVLALLAFYVAFRDVSSMLGRTIAIAFLPLEIGALVFLFRYPANLWESEHVKGLWMAAIEGEAGGFLTGCFGGGLRWCISEIGATIVIVLMLFWSGLAVFGLTPAGLFVAVRKSMLSNKSDMSKEERIAERAAERKAETKRKKEEKRQLTMEELASQSAGGDNSGTLQERMNVRVSRLKTPIVVEEILPDDPDEEPTSLESAIFPPKEEEPAPEKALDDDILAFNNKRNPFLFPDSDFEDNGPSAEREDDELITDMIRKNSTIHKTAVSEETKLDFDEACSAVKRSLEDFDPDFYRNAAFREDLSKDEPETVTVNMDSGFENDPASLQDDETYGLSKPDDYISVKEVNPELLDAAKAIGTIEENGKHEPSEPEFPQTPVYQFPPVDLLRSPDKRNVGSSNETQSNRDRLAETLLSFGIEPNIKDVVCGPTVTRYELMLNPGVKLSKITGLSDDIALALGASGVRIAAIPEKVSVVGIEVPNKVVSTVYLREMIESEEFQKSKSNISFAVGKDIGGSCIIGNIAKLPHLLIAGTTGSGKSVCMNGLIISILYKASPEDVKFIMIDPKMVELGDYNGIPHLMIPVVTDPKKASGSLQWAVSEMLRRYSIMAESGVRDLESYNRLHEDNPERKKLPQLVVVIDELADLMMAAAKEVEESICRIAQMGRAAGVHLVIATQRPSANVITGLMKANIPSRIALVVASAMESRIVLDAAGAEKLVGRGDMLFAPLGEGKAKRVQGCYVSDEEVLKVTSFIKNQGKVVYDSKVEKEIEEKANNSGKNQPASTASDDDAYNNGDRDEMLYDAVDVFMDLDQASVSVLQRKLKVGYARASRIVDQMEEMGIVGPHKGSKPRDILISKENWQRVKDGLIELEDALAAE